MNSEPQTQQKQTAAQICAETLNREVLRSIESAGLAPYQERPATELFSVSDFPNANGSQRIQGYAHLAFSASFGCGVDLTFKVDTFGRDDSAPHCEVSMSAIGGHSASMALARGTLYTKAAQCAALFDAAAEYAYDIFQRAQAREQKAAKVVA